LKSHLESIPEHWDYLPIWLLFDVGRGRVISHEEIIDNQGAFPVYSSQTENNDCMGMLSTFDFEGDYLTWTTDGAHAGRVFRRSGRFNCTNVCGTLKAKSSEMILDYAVHAAGISTSYFVRHDINPKLMSNVLAKIRIPVPPSNEQLAIASFIEGETSKIEALVAEQRRLIELLKEKRQAVISHAVTKGLDPNVKMKPSGIDWLGDVPEHWEQTVIKRFSTLQRGHVLPITVPPSKEQKLIVAFLENETVKLDTLEAEANRAITLLQERRTALISAAVTGKIDVRGFEPISSNKC